MNKRLFSIALAATALVSGLIRVHADVPAGPILPRVSDHSLDGYRLVFSDEFDGTALDTSKWNYRTDSKEWSMQKPENVTVSKGMLKLALKKEEAGGMHYTGGGVISKAEFEYGYYEARLKTPRGAGWHTSFWMMFYDGKNGTKQNEACQELDAIENDSIHPTAYGVNVHKWKGGHVWAGGRKVQTPDLATDFHVFGCEFTPAKVSYYFDGKLVKSLDVTKITPKGGAPVDFPHGPQSIWLTSIASKLGGTKAVDDTKLPETAEFDYVRFFQKQK
jgi:beta-glucanase (GH16 family)